jgi:hypothetical protein
MAPARVRLRWSPAQVSDRWQRIGDAAITVESTAGLGRCLNRQPADLAGRGVDCTDAVLRRGRRHRQPAADQPDRQGKPEAAQRGGRALHLALRFSAWSLASCEPARRHGHQRHAIATGRESVEPTPQRRCEPTISSVRVGDIREQEQRQQPAAATLHVDPPGAVHVVAAVDVPARRRRDPAGWETGSAPSRRPLPPASPSGRRPVARRTPRRAPAGWTAAANRPPRGRRCGPPAASRSRDREGRLRAGGARPRWPRRSRARRPARTRPGPREPRRHRNRRGGPSS